MSSVPDGPSSRPTSWTPPAPLDDAGVHRRQAARAVAAMLVVVVGGTAGFVYIEDWSLWRALYFTLITITTVGYGDQGISEGGQMFASVLLVGGIAVASYTLAMVVQAAVANQLAWRRRMQQKIDQLGGHAIVCGFGRMGRTVCHELAAAGIDVVVLEKCPERLRKAGDEGFPFVEGDAGEDEVLLQAGIERAKYIVAAAGVGNLVITLSARDLSPKITIIARAEGDEEIRKLHRAGADRTVSPYHSGGLEIAAAITRPLVAEFLAHTRLAGGSVVLAEVTIGEASPLVGRSLADFGKHEADRIAFVAHHPAGGEQRIPPRGMDIFAAGDRLVVAGDPVQVARMQSLGRGQVRAA